MAAPSQVRIVNAALVHLGESRRILSIDEGTPLANCFLAVWDEARDEVLADHPWNFAIAREALARSATFTPEGDQYDYAYELPADCIRWLPHRKDHVDYFAGEQEGDYILSNADAPVARFIRRVTNVSRWSVGFRTAIAAKLAMKTAKPITGQSGMIDRMGELYLAELSKGKRQDGHATGERDRTAEFRSDWLAARQRPYGAG